ncbi:MAG: hypothetical protein J0L63_19655 [Anaerolineae bacterium]|nr:hypothetical protein [Anaerolineae bacterium]
MSVASPLIPVAFHRHAAAAAAANPSGKGLVLAQLASPTCNFLALYGQCHCRQ